MRNNTAIIGAGSRVGGMLHAIWAARPGIVWVSRDHWRDHWSLDEGPAALARYLRDVDCILVLAGATPGSDVDLGLNTQIAQAVCGAAGGAHVFLASSMAVYGTISGAAGEDDLPVDPNPYGAAKFAMERAAAQTGAKLTSLRLGNVLGADMLARNMAAGKDICLDEFQGGRGPVRSYIDPVTLAFCLDRLFDLARAGRDLPRALNVASAPALDMADVLRAKAVEFTSVPAPATALPRAVMDLSLLHRLVPDMVGGVSVERAVAGWQQVEAPL